MSSLEPFEAERGRLQALAYAMLGSLADADDIVQEAYLRWQAQPPGAVHTPAAWLTTTVTRLAINRLHSAQRRRETYPGPWLPEPIVTEADPVNVVTLAEDLSLALLATLERLNPVERATFLLRDVFDLDYAEIAPIVERTEANCRQIARRARERVADPRRRFRPTADEERALISAFTAAVDRGDVDGLARLLAADVVMWSDGGSKAPSAQRPVFGARNVAKLLVRISRRAGPAVVIRHVHANGDPALLVEHDGTPLAVVAFEPAEGSIVGIRYVGNPDKLLHVARRR